MNNAEALVKRLQDLDDAVSSGAITDPAMMLRAAASLLPTDHVMAAWDYLDGYTPENTTKALVMAEVAYMRLKAETEAQRRLAGENYSGTELLSWADLREHETSFIVQDLIADNSVHYLVARPNLGKTFAYIDMVCRMAMGMDWLGKKTRQTRVLIVLGEGLNGFVHRLDAWREAHGVAQADLEPWLSFVSGSNLNNDESLELLVKHSAGHELIIFDTWSNTSGVHKEEDNGLNNETLRRATEALGQALLFVHHPRKSDQDTDAPTMRGAGALYGRAEVTMTLWKDHGFTAPDGTKREWLAMSTEVDHAGKNRVAATETIRGLYLSEDFSAPVFMQSAGEVLSSQARKVRQVLTTPMTVAQYVKASGVSEPTARRHLAKAVEEGVAELQSGSGRVADTFNPTQRWAQNLQATT